MDKSESINSFDDIKLYKIPKHDKINVFTRIELTCTVLSSGCSLKHTHTHKKNKEVASYGDGNIWLAKITRKLRWLFTV